MTPDVLLAILSSSVVSGVVGALVAGLFNLRSKRYEYQNSYYKLVLERRVAAYDQVERLITQIKVAVVDEDRMPYHLLFSDESSLESAYKLLFAVMSSALWLSDDLFDETRKLNLLVYAQTTGTSGRKPIEFGKENYRVIAETRTRIEKIHARDMLSLHEVPRFLKTKKPTDSYDELPAEA